MPESSSPDEPPPPAAGRRPVLPDYDLLADLTEVAWWNAVCSEADRLDPGWRWEDLLARQPLLTADNDAIRVALAAAAKLPPRWPDWATVIRDEDLTKTPHNQRIAPLPLGILPAAEAARELTAPLASLSAGRPLDGERPVLVHLPSETLLQLRSVASMLRFHAFLAAEDGRPDEALADGRGILGAARAAALPPMLLSAIVAVAIRYLAVAVMERALAQGEPSASALAAAQRDVQEALAAPLFLEAVRGERALCEDFVRAVDQDRVTRQQLAALFDAEMPRVTGWRALDRWIYRLRGGTSARRLAFPRRLRVW